MLDSRKLIAKAGAAHAFGQFVAIATQLALPSIIIKTAGTKEFGIYIAAQAAALIISLCELGISSGMQNRLLLNGQNNSASAAQEVYSTVTTRILLLCIIILVIYLYKTTKISADSEASIHFLQACALSACVTTLYFIFNFQTAYMATKLQEATAVFFANSARLLEVIALSIATYITRDLILGLAAQAIVRLATSIAAISNIPSEVRKRISSSSTSDELARIKRTGFLLWIQSLASVALPNVISLVALPIVGPSALGVYSAARTLSRIPVQLASFAASTISIQITRLVGSGRGSEAHSIYAISLASVCAFGILFSILSTLTLSQITKFWLGNNIHIPVYIYIAAAAGAIASSLTIVTSQKLIANSRTKLVAAISAAQVIVTAPAMAIFGSQFSLHGLAFSIASIEISALLSILILSRKA